MVIVVLCLAPCPRKFNMDMDRTKDAVQCHSLLLLLSGFVRSNCCHDMIHTSTIYKRSADMPIAMIMTWSIGQWSCLVSHVIYWSHFVNKQITLSQFVGQQLFSWPFFAFDIDDFSKRIPLKNDIIGVPELGIRRRAWGRVHLLRSGKRSGGPNLVSWHPVQSEDVGGSDYEDPSDMERADSLRSISSMGVERADLGIGIQPLSSLVLRRVTILIFSPKSWSSKKRCRGNHHHLGAGVAGVEVTCYEQESPI